MSSEKSVTSVTIVVNMEKNNPSRNERIFYVIGISTIPKTVSPRKRGHLPGLGDFVLIVSFLPV